MDWRVRMCAVLSVLVPILVAGCGGSMTSSANPNSPSLVSIAVTPANKSVSVGGTLQFKATGTFANNSTQDLTNSVTWASSNPTAATIDSAGLAKGVTSGQSATISATQSSISGSATLTVTSASSLVGVFTYHNDLSRTGQNLNETSLTTSNVNVNTFGKRFSQPVDGQIYAQPLYVPNVAIQGKGSHNVIFVATEADSVYAFDADNNAGANVSPLWKASLIDAAHGASPAATPVSNNDVGGCTDLQPIIGITATPVIDPSSGTLYVEAKSKENGGFVHRLHAIDITTGNEKAPGPVAITATVPGSGDGSSGGQLTFNPQTQNSRPGLLLLNGIVYLAFASHCDISPYHGWLFAYDISTLSQKGVYVTTPNGGLGGFWMSGAGFAADGNGNIYGATGNGTFDTTNVPATELGDSILKLSGSNLSLLDYFTAFDQATLSSNDLDVGSGGALLLPDQPGNHPHVLVQASKEGTIYLVDRDQMTAGNQHFCSNCNGDTQIVQESTPASVGGMWSMPAYWNNHVYVWGSGDVLRSIPLTNGLLDFAHITTSTHSYGFPGATPSISANGTSNGIVWSIDSSQYGSPGPGPGPAVLHAHDAANVANELWNSSQASNSRDTAGNAVKFTVPTIANGKVYIGTATEVDVYGL
ncbi:MAG: Ig-like domain-containing protein [Candidatus Acidiferrales bacterium]